MVVIQANPQFEDANAGNPQPGYRAFLNQLREETMAFSGQVVSNFTRVETFGWPFFGWVQATVDASDPKVFRFTPRPWRSEPR